MDTCALCEEEKPAEEIGECVYCKQRVCLECVVPITSTRTVDYTLCVNCEFED